MTGSVAILHHIICSRLELSRYKLGVQHFAVQSSRLVWHEVDDLSREIFLYGHKRGYWGLWKYMTVH